MSGIDLRPLANHLWQSTFFSGAVGLLTLALRRNRAAVRYWLWLAASVKFLIPFSLLVRIGSQLEWREASAISPRQFAAVVNEVSQPFVRSAAVLPLSAASSSQILPEILLAMWLCGVTLGLIFWMRLLLQVRAVKREATPMHFNLPVPVIQASEQTRMEPGIFGIFKPVLILPAGIADRLTPAQLEAVIAHELCHVHRKDNLTAAIHMIVELIFWFHPLVWWIRHRLVEERENACDEAVATRIGDPQIYAEAILNVCRICVGSPLVCVSGVSGGNLRKRIAEIMARRIARDLTIGKWALLAIAGLATVVGPIMLGILHAPPAFAQSKVGTGATPAFEVASIKPTPPPPEGGVTWGYRHETPEGVDYEAISVYNLIIKAYGIKPYQFSPRPQLHGELNKQWHIIAHAPPNTPQDQLPLMLRTLLADRFKLTLHRETKELPVYAMVAAKRGTKLREVDPPGGGLGGQRLPSGAIRWQCKCGLDLLAQALTDVMGRPVMNMTEISGIFNISFDYMPDEAARPGEASLPGENVQKAMEDALGLRLEPTKSAVEMLIVDHVGKMPTEN